MEGLYCSLHSVKICIYLFIFIPSFMSLKLILIPLIWAISSLRVILFKFNHAVPDLSKIRVIPRLNLMTSSGNTYRPKPCNREQMGSKTLICLVSVTTVQNWFTGHCSFTKLDPVTVCEISLLYYTSYPPCILIIIHNFKNQQTHYIIKYCLISST